MKLTKIALMSALAVATACGSSKKGDSVPPPTPITSAAQAESAAAASAQSFSFATGSIDFLGSYSEGVDLPAAPQFKSAAPADARLAAFRAAQAKRLAAPQLAEALRKAKSLAASRATMIAETVDCTDGGTIVYSGSTDDVAGTIAVTVTFDHCREYLSETNGTVTETMSASDTAWSVSIKFGNGNATLEPTDFTINSYTAADYATIDGTETMDLTMSGNEHCTDGAACDASAASLSANGRDQIVGTDTEITIAFNGYTIGFTEAYGDTSITHTATVNGGMSVSETSTADAFGESLTFYGVSLSEEDFFADGSTDQTIDGTIVFDFTPDDFCFEGAFSIDTQTPVHYDGTLGRVTAGKMVVNGNVTMLFNADGSVTVTLTGQAPVNYTDLESVCAAP